MVDLAENPPYNTIKKEQTMSTEPNHTFMTELDGAKENATYKIDAADLLLDIKVLIKEYYTATLTEDKSELLIKFNNGQAFRLALSEIK